MSRQLPVASRDEMTYRLSKLRVLCIDDCRDVADSTATVLELYGCKAVACYDVLSALTAAQRLRPHVCLIDLNMRSGGGCDLAARLRSLYWEPPPLLCAVSAYGSPAALKASLEAGFDLHFEKPLDWDKLLKVLAETDKYMCVEPEIRVRTMESPSGGLGTRSA